MDHGDAVALIRSGVPKAAGPTRWADLGSGSGTFTKALADLVADGSVIVAIDREHHAITSPNSSVHIQFQKGDFTSQKMITRSLDGILMANALHYVRDQPRFLQHLISHIEPGGRIVIIEYDTDRANPWVPYPVTFKKLIELLSHAGFQRAEKIGERDSIYRADKIYAAVATV